MHLGSLYGYLKSPIVAKKLDQLTLIRMAIDVCSGMIYLSEAKFVHRDLALRNVLLDKDMSCKIADFGLSIDLSVVEMTDENDNEVYSSKGQAKIPVRWTALEALLYKEFSTASDVWSFGVLIWELWSYGALPYNDWINSKVTQELIDGYRLPRPNECPFEAYKIMLDCWNKNPLRVGFMDIYNGLRSLWRDHSGEAVNANSIYAEKYGGASVYDLGADMYTAMQESHLPEAERRPSKVAIPESPLEFRGDDEMGGGIGEEPDENGLPPAPGSMLYDNGQHHTTPQSVHSLGGQRRDSSSWSDEAARRARFASMGAERRNSSASSIGADRRGSSSSMNGRYFPAAERRTSTSSVISNTLFETSVNVQPHGLISRGEAEALLVSDGGGKSGSFLIRMKGEDQWVLSIWWHGHAIHHMVERNKSLGVLVVNSKLNSNPKFTLDALVEQLQDPDNGVIEEVLMRQVPPREPPAALPRGMAPSPAASGAGYGSLNELGASLGTMNSWGFQSRQGTLLQGDPDPSPSGTLGQSAGDSPATSKGPVKRELRRKSESISSSGLEDIAAPTVLAETTLDFAEDPNAGGAGQFASLKTPTKPESSRKDAADEAFEKAQRELAQADDSTLKESAFGDIGDLLPGFGETLKKPAPYLAIGSKVEGLFQ